MKNDKRLIRLNRGETGKINTITGDSRFISRATSIGLCAGARVRVLRNNMGLPMLVYAHDTMIALSKKEAAKIRVYLKGAGNEHA